MIIKITKSQGNQVISRWFYDNKDSSIQKKYYYLDGNVYVGIDNSSGDCWVEEFKSKNKCLAWLR